MRSVKEGRGGTLQPSVRKYWAQEHVQCPHSEEEHFIATICGFVEEYHDLRVKTC